MNTSDKPPDPFAVLIGDNIRKVRKRRNWSQEQLSAMASGEKGGPAPHTISDYELGKRCPSIRTLTRIAKALGSPVDDLVKEDGEPSESADALTRDISESLLPVLGELIRRILALRRNYKPAPWYLLGRKVEVRFVRDVQRVGEEPQRIVGTLIAVEKTVLRISIDGARDTEVPRASVVTLRPVK